MYLFFITQMTIMILEVTTTMTVKIVMMMVVVEKGR